MKYTNGDILAWKNKNGKYLVYKVLRRRDDLELYHVMCYTPMDCLPSLTDVPNLSLALEHVVVESLEGFRRIGNLPVGEDELSYYYDFMRETDFLTYAEELGEDWGALLALADLSFREALVLADAGNYQAAIEQYSSAIQNYPLFYEAYDNRAFVKMELGRWEEAILDFEKSLEIEPGNTKAIFSIGECLMKIGKIQGAITRFEDCLVLEPEHELAQKFLEMTIDIEEEAESE